MDRIVKGGYCDCTTAEEFLDKLSPRSGLWGPVSSSWIFRGQESDWPLLPKAYRDDGAAFGEFGIVCHGKTSLAFNASIASLLYGFRAELDAAGLPIPTLAPEVFKLSTEKPDALKFSAQATPLLALAQHFGLPTPLLDWSTRSYIAAYFSLPTKRSLADKMVVWALRQDVLPTAGELTMLHTDPALAFMSIETAPRASNPNLHAQSGLFTWIQGEHAHNYTVDRYMTEVALVHRKGGATMPLPFMMRFTLPASCVNGLRRLLAAEGINGATMFPGYDGVVKAMKERAR